MLTIITNAICRTICYTPRSIVGGCSWIECCAAVYIYRKVAGCCSATANKIKSCCSVPVIGVSECLKDLGAAITSCCHHDADQPSIEQIELPTAYPVEVTGHLVALDQV